MVLIDTLLFDIDDTVLNFSAGEKKAVLKTFSELGIEANDELAEKYKQINALCWKRLEKGEYTREETLNNRFSLIFSEIGRNDIAPAYANEIYERYLRGESEYSDGAEDALKMLCGEYRIFGISNGNIEIQRSRAKLAGLNKYFSDIFVSEEAGYLKPDKRFFDYCFEKIGNVDKKRTMIVGDSLSADILGGKNAGILTCLVKANGPEASDIMPDYIIKSISELPEMLKNIK